MKSEIMKFHNHMMKYQKKNNIKGKCLDNSQILYDYCKNKGIKNVKTQAYICTGETEINGKKTIILIDKHMVILVNDKIIDPSYEIHSLSKKKYYKSYREFMDSEYFENFGGFDEIKLKGYLNFVKYSESMNSECIKSDKFYSDPIYYDNQFDYLINLIKK